VLSDPRFWFLGHRHLTQIAQNVSGATRIVADVRRALERRSAIPFEGSSQQAKPKIDPRVEKLIRNVKLGDWNAAKNVAVRIVESTDDSSNNELFESLLSSLYYIDDDLKWGAIQTIESIANLAPWLIGHAVLARMANHSDFTIRAVAASICMDFAQFAPDRVPLDIVFRLARYDEDWYVMAPATAALKSMARPIPGVLNFFYMHLHDSDPEAREHAAAALLDISKNEPEVLEPTDLERELHSLLQREDKLAADYIAKALSRAKQVKHRDGYKYGI
jgi:hypothetical protein